MDTFEQIGRGRQWLLCAPPDLAGAFYVADPQGLALSFDEIDMAVNMDFNAEVERFYSDTVVPPTSPAHSPRRSKSPRVEIVENTEYTRYILTDPFGITSEWIEPV